jgi:hypothetical protein
MATTSPPSVFFAGNAEELVKKLNQCDFDAPSRTDEIEKTNQGVKKFLDGLRTHKDDQVRDFFVGVSTISKTGFRPNDADMKTDELGLAGRTADGKAVKIVHGHNEDQGEDGNVVNLNARSNGGRVNPATKLFE